MLQIKHQFSLSLVYGGMALGRVLLHGVCECWQLWVLNQFICSSGPQWALMSAAWVRPSRAEAALDGADVLLWPHLACKAASAAVTNLLTDSRYKPFLTKKYGSKDPPPHSAAHPLCLSLFNCYPHCRGWPPAGSSGMSGCLLHGSWENWCEDMWVFQDSLGLWVHTLIWSQSHNNPQPGSSNTSFQSPPHITGE